MKEPDYNVLCMTDVYLHGFDLIRLMRELLDQSRGDEPPQIRLLPEILETLDRQRRNGEELRTQLGVEMKYYAEWDRRNPSQ